MWKQAQFILKFTSNEKEVQTNFIRVHRFLSNGETKKIYIDAIAPKNPWDKLKISFWIAEGNTELQIDNLEVEPFND